MKKAALLVALLVVLGVVGTLPTASAHGSCSIRTTTTKLSTGQLRGVATVTCSSSHIGGQIGVYVYKNGNLVASKVWVPGSYAWSQRSVSTTSSSTCSAPATYYAIGYGTSWHWAGTYHGYISDTTSTKSC